MKTLHVYLIAALSMPLLAQPSMQGIPGYDGSSLNRAEILASRNVKSKSSTRNIAVFSGDEVLAQFVDGDAWSTSVTFVNLDTKVLKFSLYFVADDGRDLQIPIVGLGTVRGVSFTLPVNNTITMETQGTGNTLRQGFAYIDQPLGTKVGGFGTFRQRVPGRPDFEAVVPIVSRFDDRFVLLYDNTRGFSTGIAIANPNSDRKIIPITVRDEDGKVLATRTITMDSLTHLAGSVSVTWPETVGKRGSVEFQMNGFGAGVLGLRFNPSGSFTSFHVLSNLDWLLN